MISTHDGVANANVILAIPICILTKLAHGAPNSEETGTFTYLKAEIGFFRVPGIIRNMGF